MKETISAFARFIESSEYNKLTRIKSSHRIFAPLDSHLRQNML